MTVSIRRDENYPPLIIEDYPPVGVSDLPEELIEKIFSYLGVLDLCRVGQVCKQWNRISRDNALWEDKFNSKYLFKPRKDSLISICEKKFLREKKAIDEGIKWGRNSFDNLVCLEGELHPSLILHLIKYAAKHINFFIAPKVINSLLSQEDPDYRHLLIRSAEDDPFGLMLCIAEYGIEDQKFLLSLATICAQRNPEKLLLKIGNFGLKKEKDLVTVIKIAVFIDPWNVGLSYRDLGIKSKEASQSIALLAAECSDGSPSDESQIPSAKLCIDFFGIEDEDTCQGIQEIYKRKARRAELVEERMREDALPVLQADFQVV